MVPGGSIISMLLNNGLAVIPCGGELHFHSFQSSRHIFAKCRVCQQLVEDLLHSGVGFGSFLTQHVHILEYEWSLSEGCV